ncbi:hypothetical protein DSLASN_19110 [Desulfoluna limicola]|uniref:histidine kinase n=1 Tax=Desulfoluna limicola TaxID=2810562 RepID=A0ABN6F5H7_9BACT|nr:transporter substrate-binding domain-containing protein [Desulfoluna limicola]BCS96279.1 hypothetical protein DSLASN_19110 [Desulfoluna limicola]
MKNTIAMLRYRVSRCNGDARGASLGLVPRVECRKGWRGTREPITLVLRVMCVIFAATGLSLCHVSAGQSVRVGIFQNDPLVFQDEGGTPRGIYVDLLKEIAKKEKWSLTYVPGSWNDGLDNLRTGRIDVMTSITHTAERDAYMDFSRENVLMMWGLVYVGTHVDVQNLLDMQGLRVAVLKGGINGINFKNLVDTFKVSCDLISVSTYAEVFECISSGRCDAGVLNNVYGKAHEAMYDVSLSPIMFNPFSLVFAVPEGTNDDLVTVLDSTIASWKKDKGSFYYVTLEKWYGNVGAPESHVPPWVFYLSVGGVLVLAFLFVWMRILNHQVTVRTGDLEQANAHLRNEISERRYAEEALRVINRRYHALFQDSPVPLWEEDFSELYARLECLKEKGVSDFRAYFSDNPSELQACVQKVGILDVNQATLNLHQATAKEELLGNLGKLFTESSLEVFVEEVVALAAGKAEYESEAEVKTLSGEVRQIYLRLKIDYEQHGSVRGLLATLDITERKRGEAEREKLKNQLLHAQKMESVGRLAGGVAHDYNNALSVIMGFTELAMEHVDSNEPLQEHLEEVFKAAKRATDITRQLLAFARKQAIAPMPIDLNRNIGGMLKMLRRLIGEDIELTWRPGEELWPVKMDPTQLDQILANLCVNARDAIEGTGKVTIETGKMTLGDVYSNTHAGFVPGEYVVLIVSDNGSGIEKEILDHIFEPFFTTKEVDEGTGLGLATVYGIVKQNRGFVNVYSELGRGTTIRIYLPRHSDVAVKPEARVPARAPVAHGETILLVEDDLAILKLTKKILTGLGYTVLTAGKPEEALKQAEMHSGEIHLLVTDVIMPGMNGRELAGQLLRFCPKVSALYMSGYTANVIAHHGVLEKGVHFIQKPFSKMGLASAIRSALGES